MLTTPVLTHACAIDADGFSTSGGQRRRWRDLAVEPVAGKLRWGALFESANPGFRRLDRTSKLLRCAAELCGLESLPDELRDNTALLLASSTGCLAADLRFEQSLRTEHGIEPGLFPYTLPSTVLGEIAIQHQLRGPTLCLSVAEGDEGQAIDAGRALIVGGEADAALILLGDWLSPQRAEQAQIAPKTEVVALLLQAGRPDTHPCMDVSLADTPTMYALMQTLRS